MSVKNYILLGPPGSGKSTQAKNLQETFGLAHIDIGSEMRAVAKEDTSFGRNLNEIINQRHELASNEIMSAVLEQALKRVPENAGVLIDGAPRNVPQIEAVLQALHHFERSIEKVIFISISEEDAVERISKRYLCLDCLRPYILGQDIFNAETKCGVCGGAIGQRPDDTPAGVRKRYQIFYSATLPVIEHFEKEHLLVRVDGHRSADEVFRNIASGIGQSLQETL